MVLVDGGLMANIAVENAMEFKPDIIIAVNTTSPILNANELDTPWNLADQEVSVMMERFNQSSISKADIVIEPDLRERKNNDFTGVDKLIEKGRQAAFEAMQPIKDLIKRKTDTLVNKCLARYTGTDGKKTVLNYNGTPHADSLLAWSGTGGTQLKKPVESFTDFALGNEFEKINLNIRETDSTRFVNMTADEFPVLNQVIINDNKDSVARSASDRLNSNFGGQRLKPGTYKDIIDMLLRCYNSAGFSHNEISGARFDKPTGRLSLHINTYKIGRINLKGNESTSDFLILRELKFSQGQPVNTKKILDGWSNLLSTDLFNDVDIQLNTIPEDTAVDIDIRLKEKGTQRISLGARVDDERHAQLGIDLIQENLFNFGTRVNARYTTGIRNESYMINIGNQRIMQTLVSFSLNGYYSWRNVYKYKQSANQPRDGYENVRDGETREQRYGFKALLGTQIEKKGLVSAELRYEKQRYYNLEPDVIKPPFYTINTLKIETLFDTEDRNDFPESGRVLDLALETSLFNVKDRVSFSKATVYYRSNLSIGRSTIRPSVFFGFADATLPIPEFFSLGGQDVFFGMRQDEMRGRQMALTSLEYRLRSPFSIFFDTYFSLRYDLGSVWEMPDQIVIRNLKHGVGASVSLDTPVGPATFSLGRAFYLLKNPAGAAWGPVMAYFSIGMNF
jgi:NTE family protein